jgi:hypothetical protein
MKVVVFTGGGRNANLIKSFNSFLNELFITPLFFNQNSKQYYGEWRFVKAKNYANENAQRFDP